MFRSMQLGRNDRESRHQTYFYFFDYWYFIFILSLLCSHSFSPLWLEWVLNWRNVRAQHKPVSRLDGVLS